MKDVLKLSSPQLLNEIQSWLSLNQSPRKDQLKELRDDISMHLKSKYKVHCLKCGSSDDICLKDICDEVNVFTPKVGGEGVWTNGTHSVSWLYDEVVISGRSGRCVTMQGGDFESILNGLLSVEVRKPEDLY